MSDSTIEGLIKTKKKIVLQVLRKEVSVKQGAYLLGITRQGLWKLRKNIDKHGLDCAIRGRKRGPLPGCSIWNKTDTKIEEKVKSLWEQTGTGPDRLVWFLEDEGILLSRSTVYRILIRRRLILPRVKETKPEAKLYSKGYPGEEVQIDTTEPFGKGKGILISAIDDFSRYAFSAFYFGNSSLMSSLFLKDCIQKAPFPIKAVRVDGGSEFKGDFKTTCQKENITIIRNPYHHPEKNGKVERLHRTIQEECLWRVRKVNQDIEAVNYCLAKYLIWYNAVRVHGGFGMQRRTPKQQIEKYLLEVVPIYQDVNETVIRYNSGQKCQKLII